LVLYMLQLNLGQEPVTELRQKFCYPGGG